MIVTTADLYKLAYSRYAIGAYNIKHLGADLGLIQRLYRFPGSFHYSTLERRA